MYITWFISNHFFLSFLVASCYFDADRGKSSHGAFSLLFYFFYWKSFLSSNSALCFADMLRLDFLFYSKSLSFFLPFFLACFFFLPRFCLETCYEYLIVVSENIRYPWFFPSCFSVMRHSGEHCIGLNCGLVKRMPSGSICFHDGCYGLRGMCEKNKKNLLFPTKLFF